MKKSSTPIALLIVLSVGLISFGMPFAFAQIDMVGVDIFCENEMMLGFTGLIPFLEICPIEGTSPPCILCLSPQQKASFEELEFAIQEWRDINFLSDPHLLTSLESLWASCVITSDLPGFSLLTCGGFIVNTGLYFGPIAVQAGASAIADDPPDENFESIYQIPPYEILLSVESTEQGIILENFVNSLSKQNALQQAFLVTLERYQGAVLAEEPEFVILQLTSLKEYADLMIVNQLELNDISLQYAQIVQNIISEEDLISLQIRLIDEGFSQIEIDWFLSMGYTTIQISVIQDAIIDMDIEDLSDIHHTFDGLSTSLIPLTEDLELYSEEIGEVLLETTVTPQEFLEFIILEVNNLNDEGILNNGNTNALTSKLESASDKILDNETVPAINKIDSFINQINALMNSDTLTDEQGQSLIDLAQLVIGNLE